MDSGCNGILGILFIVDSILSRSSSHARATAAIVLASVHPIYTFLTFSDIYAKNAKNSSTWNRWNLGPYLHVADRYMWHLEPHLHDEMLV